MTSRPRPFLLFLVAFALPLSAASAACDKPPAAESLKEWTQADHHSTDDDKVANGSQGPQMPSQAQGAQANPAPGGNATQLVDITWRQQCATCHGTMGRGDGQMGPMVQAPDLTREDWQASVTDAQMAAIIKTGRNKMPRFDVPDDVLQGLVARVRSLRAR